LSPTSRSRGSLRLNLMAWLVVPVVAILAASVWLSYGSAMKQATQVMDRNLTASARIIAEQLQYRDGQIGVVIPPAALELFVSDSHDEVAYAVIDQTHNLIAGFPGLTPPPVLPPEFESRFFETMFRTEAMRSVILRQPVVTPSRMVTIAVLVGETQKARDELFRTLWLRGFAEQAALVLAAALAIWVGINRELWPLLSLRQAVLQRPADRFEPFDARSVQSEVRPLVDALNRHMERLSEYLVRQKRFLDHAAHQLRTPLTIMKTQIGVARRAQDTNEGSLALTGVDENLTAMSRLTDQLLTLGQVDHDRASLRSELVDLAAIARNAVADAAPRALDRGVELVLQTDRPCHVVATAVLAREIVTNLVENAIQHAGAGTTATVTVRTDGSAAVLSVDDNGAGVAEDELTGLFERFRRGSNASTTGSGLGLSIVAEIAQMFDGSAELAAPSSGEGFCVVVRLPLVEPHDGRPHRAANDT
jgi:two-component system, OmpR family, sensor histidine kinase TctE